MDNSALIQPLATVAAAIISGIVAILVTWIKIKVPRPPPSPDKRLVVPVGVTWQLRSTKPIGWVVILILVVFFTLVGGVLGYAIGGAIKGTTAIPPPSPIATNTTVAIAQPTYISNENWKVYPDVPLGSLITKMKPVVGTDRAIEVSFNLGVKGYVMIYKILTPRLMVGTSGVRFSYRGTGDPNTFEFKLIEKDETIFEAVWPGATVTDAKEPGAFREIQYSGMNCRQYSGRCKIERDVSTLTLNPENIDRIDFAFSNRPENGDKPGSGTVIIEEILIVP